MNDTRPPLLIAGGSVRAAAASAIRAGFSPWCVDCFGDADLVRACPTQVIRDYPKAIPEMLATGPAGGWMYTGALENHPEVIDAVVRPLYGNIPAVIRLSRNPERIYEMLIGAKERAPRLHPAKVDRWLLKPRNSGGGIGIRFWNGETFDPRRWYLQEWIDGQPMSAVFLTSRFASVGMGMFRQLVGTSWLHAPGPFHYCGSIRDESAPLGSVGVLSKILKKLGVRGLIGIDAVLRDGHLWPIEVNPRYTASVEILERSLNRAFIADHVRILERSGFPPPALPVFGDTYPGKAILYAPTDFTFPAAGPWDDDYPFADLRRRFADLPHPGQRIRRGQPVLTFFTDGDSPVSTEAALRKIAGDLDRFLFER